MAAVTERRESVYRRLFQQLSVLDFLRLHLDVTQPFLADLEAQRVISSSQLKRVKSLSWPESRNELLQLLVKKEWTRDSHETFLSVLAQTQKPYVAEFLSARVDDSVADTLRVTPASSALYPSSRLDSLLKPLDPRASNELRLLLRDKDSRLARLSAQNADVNDLLGRRTAELDRLKARNARVERLLSEWEGEFVMSPRDDTQRVSGGAHGEPERKANGDSARNGADDEKEIGQRRVQKESHAAMKQRGDGKANERGHETRNRVKDEILKQTKKYAEQESNDNYSMNALSNIQTMLAALKSRVVTLEMDNSDMETTVSELMETCRGLEAQNSVLEEEKKAMQEKFVRSMEEAKRSSSTNRVLASESAHQIRVNRSGHSENPDLNNSPAGSYSGSNTPEKDTSSTAAAGPSRRAKKVQLAAEVHGPGHVRKRSDVTRLIVQSAEPPRRRSVPARPVVVVGGGAKVSKI